MLYCPQSGSKFFTVVVSHRRTLLNFYENYWKSNLNNKHSLYISYVIFCEQPSESRSTEAHPHTHVHRRQYVWRHISLLSVPREMSTTPPHPTHPCGHGKRGGREGCDGVGKCCFCSGLLWGGLSLRKFGFYIKLKSSFWGKYHYNTKIYF